MPTPGLQAWAMATFSVSGRQFEIIGFAPVHEPGYHFECYELTPDGRGLLGSIVVLADDGPPEVEFRFVSSVEISVLRRWTASSPNWRTASCLRPLRPCRLGAPLPS